MDYSEMTISELAEKIREDWGKVHYSAVPYLSCMRREDYGLDGQKDIILRFLCNSSTWKGPVAREIKAELRSRIK